VSPKSAVAVVGPWSDDSPALKSQRFEMTGADRFTLAILDDQLRLEMDRVRVDRGDLWGTLTVRTTLSGSRRAYGDVLTVGTINLSSPETRYRRANGIASLLCAPQIDVARLLEGLAARVHDAVRQGEPSVDLATVTDDGAGDETVSFLGITVPVAHPTISFGDGDTMKSFLALWYGTQLANAGLRVGLGDYELQHLDHHRRLRQIAGPGPLPPFKYLRCTRPLVHEAERLRAFKRRESLDYLFIDSAGFGCIGAPESAEAALGFMQAVRYIDIGTWTIAHITKGTQDPTRQNDQKPFGSVFWHNSARCTWNVKLEREDEAAGAKRKIIGLFNRKNNLGDRYKPVGIAATFERQRVFFAATDLRETAELSQHLHLKDRIANAVRRQPYRPEDLAEELGADVDTINRTVRRYKDRFQRITGSDDKPRIVLVERHR
jgi:hypothetical protein